MAKSHKNNHDHESMDCPKLLRDLSDFIDGQLSPDICASFEDHLAQCENCRVVFDTTNRTILLYQNSAKEETLPEGTRERLFKKLSLEDLLKK